MLQPDAGSARVLGHDVVREASAVRQKMSLTGQFASVDEDLTGHENLVLVGRLLGLSWRAARQRATELHEAFDLAEAAGRQLQTYSGGMRRRIDIAASLVAIPELLFLDEPTTGLDPRSRTQVWELVRQIAAEGTTVLLTTQYLDEAYYILQPHSIRSASHAHDSVLFGSPTLTQPVACAEPVDSGISAIRDHRRDGRRFYAHLSVSRRSRSDFGWPGRGVRPREQRVSGIRRARPIPFEVRAAWPWPW